MASPLASLSLPVSYLVALSVSIEFILGRVGVTPRRIQASPDSAWALVASLGPVQSQFLTSAGHVPALFLIVMLTSRI